MTTKSTKKDVGAVFYSALPGMTHSDVFLTFEVRQTPGGVGFFSASLAFSAVTIPSISTAEDAKGAKAEKNGKDKIMVNQIMPKQFDVPIDAHDRVADDLVNLLRCRISRGAKRPIDGRVQYQLLDKLNSSLRALRVLRGHFLLVAAKTPCG